MSQSHVNTGFLTILEAPAVYNTVQAIIGGQKEKRNYFKNYFKFDKKVKILDIGCGTGFLLKFLSGDYEYHGVDFEKKYIDYVSQKYAGKDNFFYCEKVGEKERKEWLGQFDIINAHGLLHHLSDEDSLKLMSTAKKYLKEGGFFITVDTVMHENQSFVSKFFASKDRGRNVRNPNGYLKLAEVFFKKVESKLDTKAMNIPFSLFIMKMYK